MPALPWNSIRPPESDRTYVGFATKLPLTGYRHIPGFLQDTSKIRRQLAAAPGLIGYALLAELRAKTFWTVSVWDDEPALRAFSAAEPHRSITRRMPARMGRSVFRTFDVTGRDLPLSWPGSKVRFE